MPPHLKRCGLLQAFVFRMIQNLKPHPKGCGFRFMDINNWQAEQASSTQNQMLKVDININN